LELATDPAADERNFVAELSTQEWTRQYAVPLFQKALSDSDERVRDEAVGCLILVNRHDLVLDILVSIVMSNRSYDSRDWAFKELQSYNDKAVVQKALVDALPFGDKEGQRMIALLLTRVGTPETLAAVEAWRASQRGDRDV
jgi:hypothetical protein